MANNFKNNKTALVTGASRGIGKAIAKYLSEKEGYHVYAVARSTEKLEQIKTKNITPLPLDVTDEVWVKKSIGKIMNQTGQIDLLINNAGYGIYGTVEGLPSNEVQRGFDVNVFGVGNVLRAVIPEMRKQKNGTIINISSMVGKIVLPMASWYGASKHAIEGLTDGLRIELNEFGIKVILIEPGSINTGFREIALGGLEKSSESSDYNRLRDVFIKVVRKSYTKGSSTEAVIKELQRALHTRLPRARYVAGRDAKMNIFFRKIFNDRMIDRILLSMFK